MLSRVVMLSRVLRSLEAEAEFVYTIGVHNESIHVGIRELRANLSGLLRRVRQGATITVVSRNEVVAELKPPAKPEPKRRRPGALKGKIWIAPDFDELPADVLDAMENG